MTIPDFPFEKHEHDLPTSQEFTIYHEREAGEPENLDTREDCSAAKVQQLSPSVHARTLTCWSYRQAFLSCTARRIGRPPGPVPDGLAHSGYLSHDDPPKYFNKISEISEILAQLVFGVQEKLDRAEGLVIITGTTNSSKSKLCRGLIHFYMRGRLAAAPDRVPHLVTFEDPIEALFAAQPSDTPQINYTPRQAGLDAVNLRDALADALRQTPEALYVGEIRSPQDWGKVLDFAGTGHLVVTTAHAGSLQEAMRNVFRAVRARTPADRSAIAERLLAVVHLRPEKLPKNVMDATCASEMVVPSLWRYTRQGAMAIMQYGLSSIIPYLPEGRSCGFPPDDVSCLGRAWFVNRLICEKEKIAHDPEPKVPEWYMELSEQAAGWDLEGR